MKKMLLILLILSALTITANASVPRIRYGAEWGAAATFYAFENYTFMTEEQFMVRAVHSSGLLHANGCIYGFVGADMALRLNLSAYMGYAGLGPGFRVFPFGLQSGWHFRGTDQGGPFIGAGAAVAADFKAVRMAGFTERAFAGWRMDVGAGLSLDLKASLQISTMYPSEFNDPYTGAFVPQDRVQSTRASYLGILFTVALCL